MASHAVSRRRVLRKIGAAGAGAITVGSGTAGADETDRHIVGTRTDTATDAAKRKADSVRRVIEFRAYPTAVAGEFSDEALDALRQRRDVEYVEEDVEHEVVGQVLPWGIDRVDGDVAHANSETGGDNDDGEGGADIAVVDTGIDSDHPDLAANLGEGKAVVECLTCDEPWGDDHDHGTHVAGTADAVDDDEGVVGVSTAATLHAVKVCDSVGLCLASDIADGLKWAADQGYDVANLSLGGGYSETIDNAGKYAYDAGILLVAAAGNDGPCEGCVSYPAANEEFVAVSATTCDDSLADFSSTGCEVELAAPGKAVYSTVVGGYDTFSGTSMAAPHVAGSGAQLMDNGYPNAEQTSDDAERADCYPAKPGGARGRLQDTAEDIDLASAKQGDGLVDAAAALDLDSSDDGLGNGPNCGDDGVLPVVESLSLSGNDTEKRPNADFTASWAVSDTDGDLDTVELTLTDTHEREDSATVDVSGDTASGDTSLSTEHGGNSGRTYEVELVVTDSNGNTDSATADEGGGGS